MFVCFISTAFSYKESPFLRQALFPISLSVKWATLVADLKGATRNDGVGVHAASRESRVREEGATGKVVVTDDATLAGHKCGRGAIGGLDDLDTVLGQELVLDGGDALGDRLGRVRAERVDQCLVLKLEGRDVRLDRVRAAVADADRSLALLVGGLETSGDRRQHDDGVLSLLGRRLQAAGDGRQEREGRRWWAAAAGEPNDRVGLGVLLLHRLRRLGDGGRGDESRKG